MTWWALSAKYRGCRVSSKRIGDSLFFDVPAQAVCLMQESIGTSTILF
jgi:hypothetical protein